MNSDYMTTSYSIDKPITLLHPCSDELYNTLMLMHRYSLYLDLKCNAGLKVESMRSTLITNNVEIKHI